MFYDLHLSKKLRTTFANPNSKQGYPKIILKIILVFMILTVEWAKNKTCLALLFAVGSFILKYMAFDVWSSHVILTLSNVGRGSKLTKIFLYPRW